MDTHGDEQAMFFVERTDELARALYDAKRFREAAQIAEATVSLSDRSFPSLLNAARCHVYAGEPVRAEALLREAHAHPMRPLGDHSDRELLSLSLSWQGRYDDAEQVSLSLPESPARSFNLGWHRLRRGEFRGAFPLLERGRAIGAWGDNDFTLPTPQWDGVADLKGKTVLLNLERGLGDHIIQVRHARDLAARGAFVLVRTHPSLVMALSQAEGVGLTLPNTADEVQDHDFWLSGMWAPAPLGLDKPDSRPYLRPVPWLRSEWEERMRDYPRPWVALRWQGNPQFEYEQMRTIPADRLADALRPIGGTLFSVQRDAGSEALPAGVVDLAPHLNTWEDTITALSLMDVVVTSCTSIAHASAAQGTPTVVITPILPYYPWSDETKMPESTWYSNTLVARQNTVGQWDAPIAEAAEYAKRLLERGRSAPREW